MMQIENRVVSRRQCFLLSFGIKRMLGPNEESSSSTVAEQDSQSKSPDCVEDFDDHGE